MPFEDHFSKLAQQYARYRPQYPRSLYASLSELVSRQSLALDIATGNGQAAVGLAEFFDRVVASDASELQLAKAHTQRRVQYLVARAEQLPLASGSADLVTAAQAAHWFDLGLFYAEARRALRPGGILAVWGYHFSKTTPATDQVVREFYYDTVGAYWPPQMRLLEEGYRNLPFAFQIVDFPEIAMTTEWGIEQYLGFISSWSAVQRFQDATGYSPLPEFQHRLEEAWGDPKEKKVIHWPIAIKVGRNL